MRIVFFGTPDFAVASLKALVDANYEVAAVVTAPDKPAGRGHHLQHSAVKTYALEVGIPVLQPEKLKDEGFVDSLRFINPDIQIVVAFRMLPEIVWDMPQLGTYNVHASLLPAYRGAAPINWAIINGEKETGVTTFKLQHEIDTGNILLQKKLEIGENETAGELYERLMLEGADLLVRSLELIKSEKAVLYPQPNVKAPHAPKLFKEHCLINLNQSSQGVHDFIRGLSPVPGAYITIQFEANSTPVNWKLYRSEMSSKPVIGNALFLIEEKNLYVACDDFYLKILEIQAPGKAKMDALAFINGFKSQIEQARLIL
jgi:methionyl-tRNA formyltransferase